MRLTVRYQLYAAATGALLASMMTACFTGIESTPRIKDSEVARVERETQRPEAAFMAAVQRRAPAAWQSGSTALYVTDSKISLIFSSASSRTDSLAGHTITFDRFEPAVSVTGAEATDVIFRSDRGDTLHYMVSASTADILARNRLDVPFTVDLAMVAQADSLLRGNTYYVTIPTWIDTTGRAVDRLRHVAVVVDSVGVGDHNYPLRVYFHRPEELQHYSLLMTVGFDRASTRNFDTLFSFTDPRKQYPHITDEMWTNIIHSRLAEGMTPDEARLAMGTPHEIVKVPSTAGMVERWAYDDGVYLIFEDGYLTRYRK